VSLNNGLGTRGSVTISAESAVLKPTAWSTTPCPDERALLERYGKWTAVPAGEWIKLSRAIKRWRRKHPQLAALMTTTAIFIVIEPKHVKDMRVLIRVEP
jgi:hypothetical protein